MDAAEVNISVIRQYHYLEEVKYIDYIGPGSIITSTNCGMDSQSCWSNLIDYSATTRFFCPDFLNSATET